MRGDDGDEVEPCGNPVIATFTVPAKPFCPETVIVTAGPMVPTVMEMAEGLMDKLKFGGGGGPDEPPPQLTTKNAMTDAKQSRATKLLETLKNLLFANIAAP